MSNLAPCPECGKLRAKIAALRADRNIWRQMCIELFGVVRTLRDVILGK